MEYGAWLAEKIPVNKPNFDGASFGLAILVFQRQRGRRPTIGRYACTNLDFDAYLDTFYDTDTS
ncbi:hypothetical protein FRC12_015913 [Ceratobasidium sp. 428]|nr:hypothetical protein FRC12_015913 [Ceratobasidium sp. 428]